jgi:hypothetical protein
MSCGSQFTVSDTACMSPNLAWNFTNTTTSKPSQASCTPYFSYPLVSSTSFSSLSRILLFLVHNSTIIAEYKVHSSLSIFPSHYHKLTPSIAYTEYSIHRVQNIQSTAYTEFTMHWVQHTCNLVCLPFILIITSWPLNLALTSSVPPHTIDHHQPALHDSLKLKPPCRILTVTS